MEDQNLTSVALLLIFLFLLYGYFLSVLVKWDLNLEPTSYELPLNVFCAEKFAHELHFQVPD